MLTYVSVLHLEDPADRKFVVIPSSCSIYSSLARKVKRGDGKLPVTPAPPTAPSSDIERQCGDCTEDEDEDEWVEHVERELGDRVSGSGVYRMVAGVLTATSTTTAGDSCHSEKTGANEGASSAKKRNKAIHLPAAVHKPVHQHKQPSQNGDKSHQQSGGAGKEKADQTLLPIRLSKEQLLTHMKGLLTKYHAIVLPSGALYTALVRCCLAILAIFNMT